MPETATGRFRFALLLLGAVAIIGLGLWFAAAINEPIRLRGFAI
jgi:hypothetical protein